ncbi:17497_t:CDS:2, partial [Entrophospora sp. SA101]
MLVLFKELILLPLKIRDGRDSHYIFKIDVGTDVCEVYIDLAEETFASLGLIAYSNFKESPDPYLGFTDLDRTWSGVCDCHRGNYNCDIDCLQESVDKESDESLYYKVVLNLFDNMASEFQDSKVWLIGHSLGGSLASLLGLTHGLPVVAYEAPGERRAAKKLHLPGPPAVPYELLPIWHIGQTADPIYMGLCNGITSWCYLGGYAMETKCHVGKACVFDVVEKLKWGVSLKTHSIKEVIEKILTLWNVTYNFALPECKHEHECEDCGLWNY